MLFKDDLERLIGKRPHDIKEALDNNPNVNDTYTVSTNTDVKVTVVENDKP